MDLDEICSFHSQENDFALGLEFPVTGQPPEGSSGPVSSRLTPCVLLPRNGKFCFYGVKKNSCLLYLSFSFAFLVGDGEMLNMGRLK